MSVESSTERNTNTKHMPLLEAKFPDVVEVKIDPCFAIKQLFSCVGLTEQDIKSLNELSIKPKKKKKVSWAASEEDFSASFVEVSKKAKEAKGKNSFLSFDCKREDSLNPNYVTSYGMDEEVPYNLPYGDSSWCDNEIDAELYQVLKLTNSFLTDDNELKENMKHLIKMPQIKEAQLLNWHKRGPNPLRYLMGNLLLSNNLRGEIKKISPQVVRKIIIMIDKTVTDLESEKISIYVLYEAGAKIFKKNTDLLKTRSKIMKESLEICI